MATSKLSDAACRAAKPKAGIKITKWSDGGGLQLWLMAEGSKLWRLAYRFGGKQKTLYLGAYPSVGLGEAREARDAAQKLLRQGRDPSKEKSDLRAARAIQAASTFRVVADELLAQKRDIKKVSPATIEKTEWLFSLAMPALGERPVAEITPAEVLAVLTAVGARGRHATASTLRGLLGQVFRLAWATGRCAGDPTQALRGALARPKTVGRPAITDPKKFGALLRALDGLEGGMLETKLALQLLALTFVRPGELRAAVWTEFDFDAARWVIPAARMKSRKADHIVPLSAPAIAILRELKGMARGPFVFSSARGPKHCMNENTLSGALRRLGFPATEMCPHGFRSAASSMLNESGKWHADAIEHQLAHAHGDSVRMAYARAKHLDERKRMMDWWAVKLDEMRANTTVVRAA